MFLGYCDRNMSNLNPEMVAQILTKKTLSKRASFMNENVGSKISDFARKQMEKMGWRDGQGLGKNEDGISTHIKVKKIENNEGIGESSKSDEDRIKGVTDQWWYGAFDKNAKKFKIKCDEDDDDDRKKKSKKTKKEKKSKKEKKEKKSKKSNDEDKQLESEDEDSKVEDVPTYDELFKATGGIRLGMRARSSQIGKFKRTEGIIDTQSEIIIAPPSKKKRL